MPASGYAIPLTPSVTVQNALLTSTQYVVPTTGTTITADGSSVLLLDPAGTLLALTVTMPATPIDKQRFTVSTSQVITGLTITGTIVGTLTTMALGGFACFQWNATAAKWFRVG